MPLLAPAHPFALLLLPLVLLAVRLGRRRTGARWRIATALRATTLTFLILALSGPVLRVPSPGTAVVFAVDRSLSITEAGRRMEAAFLRDALSRMHREDRAGIVTFAGRPSLRSPVGPHTAADDPGPAFDPDATDIGAALDLALRVLPGSGARRIVVLSDGGENQGDAVAAARTAAAAGVAIDAVAILTAPPDDVLVEDLVAPQSVHPGEAYTVSAVLHATAEARATLTLRRNGEPIAARRLILPVGETAVRFSDTAAREGVVRYRVDVTATPDAIAGNDHGEALVIVRGRPRVLFVSGSPSALPAWLARQGLRVDVRPPGTVPVLATDFSGYGSVVLDDVAAADLSRAQQEALRAFVRAGGGGVVAIGGPHSFGVGGYAGTPLEDLLPVKMDVREMTALPTVAILLVIDTSGSMEAFGTELAKEELAKEIASSVIDLLGEHDQIGVITFDQEYRWLVPPTEARNRARVLDEVARLRAGGGTVMYPPLAAARAFLRASPAKVRHVIVLSDGLTDPGDFRRLATEMTRDRITLSTVAIGSDADVEFMRNLARWGGGRSYFARDLYSIPEIFTTEALVAVRSYIVEEPTRPLQTGSAPTLEGLAPPPPLDGYVATVPKPAADVGLTSPRRDPILATWRYGLGRTVAFTSDDGLRWTARWAGWRDVARFWSQTIRWTLRDEGSGLSIEISRDRRGALARAVLDARHPDGAPWDGLEVGGEVESPQGTRGGIALEQTAPGRYEGTWPATGPGIYTLTLSARDGRGVVGIRTAGLVVPYSPELRVPGGNVALLARLVEMTGGALLHRPEDAFRPGRGSGTRDVWPPLAGLALGTLLAEVIVRRVPALAQYIAGAAAAIANRGGGTAAREARRLEDRAYDSADRWASERAQYAKEDALRAASMEHAARLYIARLRKGPRS
ncbi:MAG TPA: VWA domain-containing protein [bacterium]|nr:VWA domain-containing protein [bacterium]